MTAGKAPQAILRVMHNSLSESDSEGIYSIIPEPFALALASSPGPTREGERAWYLLLAHARVFHGMFLFP